MQLGGMIVGEHGDVVELCRQRLQDIPIWMSMHGLRELYVSDNLINRVAIELIAATPHLKVLDLSYNRLSSLPAEISQWQRLTVLRADRNNITSLPASITEMAELEVLSLASNFLADVPDLTRMRRLKHLSLVQNSLPSYLLKIYMHIFQSSGSSKDSKDGGYNDNNRLVQTTIIVNEGITSPMSARLPSSTPSSKLPNTQHCLSINNVSPISSPHSESASKSLRLDLESSNFTYFPFSFENVLPMTKLQRLCLGHNHKIDFERCAPSWLSFRFLKIGKTENIESLAGIQTLQKINLNHNFLKEFPRSLLTLKISQLMLDYNQISSIPNEIRGTAIMDKISLDHNRLSSAPSSPIMSVMSLSVPDLPPLPGSPYNEMMSPCPMSPSMQTPTSPLSLSKRPPKPLPVPPPVIKMAPLGLSVSSVRPLPPPPLVISPTVKPMPHKPRVPPLRLKNTGGGSLTNSTSNTNISSEAAPPVVVDKANPGLGARVRSFTSCDYTTSVQRSDEPYHDGKLHHTTSSSSCGSWQEDDPNDLLSPGCEMGGPPYTHRPRVTSPMSTLHSPSSTNSGGANTNPPSKEKRSITKKTADLLSFAKQSLLDNTIHFRKKSVGGTTNSTKQSSSTENLTPRGSSPVISPQPHKDEICMSSPSTPRPQFPERNGSTSSLNKDDHSSSPTPRIREKRMSRQVVIEPIRPPTPPEPIIEQPPAVPQQPANLVKSRTFSENNLMEYLPMSQSLPSHPTSILMQSMDVRTNNNDDDIRMSSATAFTQKKSIESGTPTSGSGTPPIVVSTATTTKHQAAKFEFIEEIYDERGNQSFWKKRLAGLLQSPAKALSSTSNPSLPPAIGKKLSDPLKKMNKTRKKSTDDSGGNGGGGLRESTSNINLSSSALLSNSGSIMSLDGDDFIRDLMASPIINQEIEFTSEDGVPKIKTASLKMLISLLTHEKGQSKELENIFFDTYSLFTNIEVVIGLLHERFYLTGKNNSPIIKHKVLRFVQRWVDTNWEDFSAKQVARLLELCKSFQETVEQGMTTTYTLKNQISTLTNIITLKRDDLYFPDDDTWEQPAPIPDFTFQENFTLLDLKSHEIARQLVMIDHGLLVKITRKELLDYVQSQSNPPASIVNVTNRFNFVSRWVASEITSCATLEKRIALIFKFINIALNCWVLKNFNSCTAIIAGMKHGAVCRLKSTWHYVNSTKASAIFQEFEDMISPTSIARFRKIMDSVEPPSVPYLGSYFHHLVGITEGNKSVNSNDQINLMKYEMIGRILSRVHLFQSKTYNLASVGVLQTFLNNGLQLTEDQLYDAVDSKKEEKIDASQLESSLFVADKQAIWCLNKL
eukprot:gene12135-14197_t